MATHHSEHRGTILMVDFDDSSVSVGTPYCRPHRTSRQPTAVGRSDPHPSRIRFGHYDLADPMDPMADHNYMGIRHETEVCPQTDAEEHTLEMDHQAPASAPMAEDPIYQSVPSR